MRAAQRRLPRPRWVDATLVYIGLLAPIRRDDEA
jgi:hypothetical protein